MNFYTYLWLREDGSPYYAGKGTGKRALQVHRIGNPPPTDRIILQDWPSEDLAFEGEKLLIAYYGRKDQGTGCLRNLTDGGEGPANPSEATRRKIGEASRLKVFTDAHRRKIGDAHRGKKRIFSVEHRQRLSESMRGNKAFFGKKQTEEARSKIRTALTGRKVAFETRSKVSARLLELWKDPTYRRRMSEAHRGKKWTDKQHAARKGKVE